MHRISYLLLAALTAFTACASNGYNTKLREARTLLDGGELDTALSELQNLIETRPERPGAYYLLGLLNYRRGNYYECLKQFEKAERYGLPADSKYLREKGIALYFTGDLTEAGLNLQRSLDMQPSVEAYRYLGLVLYESGDYSGAAETLAKALEETPRDPDLISTLARAYHMEGKTSEAAEVLMRAPLKPEDCDIVIKAANTKMLDGRYEEAVELLSAVPVDSPCGDVAGLNLGEAYIECGDYASAARVLGEYLKKRPDSYEAGFNLAAALLETGDLNKAVDILTGLYESRGSDVRVMYNLGIAYQRLGAFQQSVRLLGEAVREDPDNAAYRYAYAVSLTESGNISAAREQIEAILSVEPSNDRALKWLERYGGGEGKKRRENPGKPR